MAKRKRQMGQIATIVLVLTGLGRSVSAQWTVHAVDSPGDVGWGPSIALASDGAARVSYYDRTNESIKYAVWNGSSWDVQTVSAAGVWGSPGGVRTSLVLDALDRPRIAYKDNTNSVYNLKYAAWNGTTWDVQTVDHTGSHVGTFASLALDSQGRPRVSYDEYTGGVHRLKYAQWNGTSWLVEIVDSNSGAGVGTSLALDTDDRPHISYRDGLMEELRYARWDGSSWVIETVDSTGNVGTDPSLVLSADGKRHISYRDAGNKDLKYAKWNGSSWVIETVDASGDVGEYTSIVLDAGGAPRISYYKRSALELKYAAWDASSWNIETIVTATDALMGDRSLVLDVYEHPWISYREYAGRDLRIAQYVPEPGTLVLLALGACLPLRRRRR